MHWSCTHTHSFLSRTQAYGRYWLSYGSSSSVGVHVYTSMPIAQPHLSELLQCNEVIFQLAQIGEHGLCGGLASGPLEFITTRQRNMRSDCLVHTVHSCSASKSTLANFGNVLFWVVARTSKRWSSLSSPQEFRIPMKNLMLTLPLSSVRSALNVCKDIMSESTCHVGVTC